MGRVESSTVVEVARRIGVSEQNFYQQSSIDRSGQASLDCRTKAYLSGRTTEGLSKSEIVRCLKRYVAWVVFQAL